MQFLPGTTWSRGGVMRTCSGTLLQSLLVLRNVLCEEAGDRPCGCPADRSCPHKPFLPLRHGARPGVVRGFTLSLVVLRAGRRVLQRCVRQRLEHCCSCGRFL